jgi:uncharacterized protein (DUF58 family)
MEDNAMSRRTGQSSRRWLVWTLTAIAAVVGAVYGYQFGVQLSGLLLGVVLALNGAAFSSILVGAAADRLFGPRRPPRDDG